MSGFSTATNHLLSKIGTAADAAKLGNVPAANYRRLDGQFLRKLLMGSDAQENWDGIIYDEGGNAFRFFADQAPDNDTPLFEIRSGGALEFQGATVLHSAQSAGAIGTYALLTYDATNVRNPGYGLAGTVLRWGNAHGSTGGRPSGNWRLMAYLSGSSDSEGRTGLFLRYA